MKKLFFSLLFFWAALCTQSASAQYVTIPDANFRAQLMSIYSSCFNSSGQLDTLCAQNSTNYQINVSYSNIANLEGIKYFKNVKNLYCSNNQLTSLPNLPSGLQTLDCGSNQLTSLPALPSGLQTLDCGSNQLTSLPALPSGLQNLNCYYNQLTNLPTLPVSLQYLSCQDNQLTSLPTLPSGLHSLNCYYNQLTSLPTLPSALSYLACSNNQLTSLPTLPSGLNYLSCQNNQLTSLPTLPSGLNYLSCQNNQLISLPALPNSLRYLYCQNNQLTSLPTLLSNLVELYCNDNQLSSLPILPNGLSFLICYNNPLNCLPLLPPNLWHISVTNTNISCIPNSTPNLVALINGDSLSPTSLPPICNPTNNSEQCNVYPKFLGYTFLDANNNGIKDASESGVAYVKVTIGNGISVYSDNNGYYEIAVPDTGTFTASVPAAPLYFTFTPASQTVHFTAFGQVSLTNFGQASNLLVNDLKVNLTNSRNVRSGFGLDFTIDYANQGTLASNGVVKFLKPALYTIDSTSLEGYIVNNDTLIWNVGNLTIGATNKIIVYGTVSTAAVLGSSMLFWAGIQGNNPEETPENNVKTLNLTVVGSFDPNDKQARPEISPAQIAAGEYIDYIIRFQNTGTDTAFTVVIADTLANTLQTNTLEVVSSSHNVRTSLNGSVVYFEHLNILLPDSNVNEKASHGFVSFRIKPKVSLAVGATVSNKAAIYFDYNAPVITNTAVTKKVQNTTGIFDKINKTLSVYPNPVENGVLYVPNMVGAAATLTSLEGKELRNWSTIGESVSLEGIAQGMYLLKVTQKGETRTAKVMVK
ncbi:conserved repeat domain-containing protein/Por secretion system C-terminal sorting domain-containing protein [Flexibacter flexilis DSM 6793]|uniref:Conserved repeat domain-containing protein/Por secretion system C-terminal sorting domain-containing protein n=1 Tax=Flexibacter flexilis DSM 6793 TaxID=927664 RepID=A0A1I1L0V0_9BACT|nr:leucine-rich repeat domain-containing protein [Flexibacter flexilis]SFC66555.1 conserved repeat domain-containing protein/Por secretion system C-terminal sorting domain-containing protein [Flexibacter flexilis DSM 6793]